VRAAADDVRDVLVAATGHAWLRDQAFGLHLLERLRHAGIHSGVELADWSFGTVTAFQKLAERPCRRAIFVSATPRDREAGVLYRFRPNAVLPPPDEIHARIADAVMGMVSIDTLWIMGRHFGALPDDVVFIEAEPVDETWGDELSPELAALLGPALRVVEAEIGRPFGTSEALPAHGPNDD
jgi:hydrogenase maturation protease